MKSLKLKGFTLIECIVAMAIIGIASMLIAQVYGAVAIMNRNNAALNTSLVEQMKMAERGIAFKDDAKLAGQTVSLEDAVRQVSYTDKIVKQEASGSTPEISKNIPASWKTISGLKFELKQVGDTGTIDTVGSGAISSTAFKIQPGVTGTGYNAKAADIELVVLKAKKQTDTISGSNQSFKMDDTIRYKFILSKTAANADLLANYSNW